MTAGAPGPSPSPPSSMPPPAVTPPATSGAPRPIWPVQSAPRRPLGRRPGGVLLLVVGALAFLADQASKRLVQDHFVSCDYAPGQVLIPHWLSLIYTCNTGAAFGLLANETLLFVLIAVVVIGVIVAYFRFLPANRPWLKLSLGLQLGGALGNLVDRLRQGFVTDFIYVRSFPVFNVADSCIVIGVMILAYYLLFAPAQSKPSNPANTTLP